MMKIYNYHPATFELIGQSFTDPDPMDDDGFLMPAHATALAPPTIPVGKVALWTGSEWTILDDFRSQSAYRKSTGDAVPVSMPGDLDAALTLDPRPTAHHVFDDVLGAWTIDAAGVVAAVKEAAAVIDAQAETARLKFITTWSGQALAYEAKRREADAWGMVIAAAGTPVLPDYPWMRGRAARLNGVAEAAVTQPQMQVVADEWAAKAAIWEAAGIAIENIREQAKEDLASALTIGDIDEILWSIVWPAPV